MKGIILAGGKGSRLYPMTKVLSKQLLPIFDKPLIYYPLATLMLAGIRDILVITTAQDRKLFEDLLGDGKQWGLSFNYAVQDAPRGLPDAFVVGRDFIGDDAVALVLGDNIFYGEGLREALEIAGQRRDGATIFAYYVKDPQRYGVVQLDANSMVINIEEKPLSPKSNYAITGLYFFDNDVVRIARDLHPSARGETEIVDVLNDYWRRQKLRTEILGRGMAWLDTGTPESLQAAASYIQTIEMRQGLKISCPEEIAFRSGFIDREQLLALSREPNAPYTEYLRQIAGV